MKVLSLSLFALLCSSSLFAQKSISGEITGDEALNMNGIPSDEYVINIKKDRMLEVWLNSNDFDAYLIIEGPDGQVWYNDDSDDKNSYLSMLATPGKYTIWAGSYSADSRGSYELKYLKGSEVSITRLEGRLDDTDDQLPKGEYVDTFEENINIEGPFDIRLKGLGFTGYLCVTSPSGRVYRSGDYYGSGDYVMISDVAPDKGKWTIQVTSDYVGEMGAYDLEILDFGVDAAQSGGGNAIELD